MKALFIGSDPTLFDTTSAAYQRMYTYAQKIGTLHILMRTSAEGSSTTHGPLTIHGLPIQKFSFKEFARSAHELIVSEGIEIVSAQDPFEHGWVASRAVVGTNTKLHIQVHTDFLSPWFTRGGMFRSAQVAMPLKNTLRRRIAPGVLKRADGIRVVSKRIEASLVERFRNKIVPPVTIPIAVSSMLPAKVAFPFQTLPFTFVTVGRLEPEKRIDDCIEAIAQVREKYPIIGLVILGDGRERARLEKKVKDLALTDRITFLGSRSDAWGLMQSAQGYIQSSAYEGYGVTLLEAALARLPIITTDVGIIGEVLKGYEDVLASPPGDAVNLAAHIIALMEDVALKEKMVRSAQIKAFNHLQNYHDIPELIARDLESVIKGRKKLA